MKYALLATLLASLPLLASAQTFSAPVRNYAGSTPFGLAVGDLNNDTYPDIVSSAFFDNAAGVLLNKKDGTFASVVAYRINSMTGYNRFTSAVGDVDNDGYQDIVAADYRTGLVSVLLNKKNATFATPVLYPNYGGGTFTNALIDLDRDDYLDIIQGTTSSSDTGPRGISTCRNKKDGTFAPPVGYMLGAVPNDLGDVTFGDMNGDGYPDVVVSYNISNAVGVLLNKKDGTFAAPLMYPVGMTGPGGLRLGDMNRDGVADVVVVSKSSIAVLLNQKDGTLGTPVITAVSSTYDSLSALAVGDLNGDAYADVAVGIYNSGTLGYQVGVLLNTKANGLTKATRFTGTGVNILQLADVNKDGKLDILALSLNDYSIDVRLNQTTFLATEEAQAAAQLHIAPNPATGSATLALTNLPASTRTLGVTLTDALGRLVLATEHPIAQADARVTLPNLAPGVYLVRLTHKDAQGTNIGTLPVQRLSVQ